jgi:hypothetical protein
MGEELKGLKPGSSHLMSANGNSPAVNSESQVKQSPSANTPVIAPRLRIEDLKPPPAKRQKQNPKVKEEKAVSPAKVKAESDSNSRAASPPQPKRPASKNRKKPTGAGGGASEPIDVDATSSTLVDLTTNSPSKMEEPTPAPGRDIRQNNGSDNILGIQLGEQMVKARQQADTNAQADAVMYLSNQWKRLEGVLKRHDQSVLDNIRADLAIDIDVPFDDSLTTYKVQVRNSQAVQNGSQTAWNGIATIAPAPTLPEGFDYSSFIDFTGLEDDNDSAPTVIAATPDLLGPGDPRFEVSPSSEGPAGTPRQPLMHHHKAPIGTVSPVQENLDLFGEDGWLTEGLVDSKWDEHFDPNAAQWNFT